MNPTWFSHLSLERDSQGTNGSDWDTLFSSLYEFSQNPLYGKYGFESASTHHLKKKIGLRSHFWGTNKPIQNPLYYSMGPILLNPTQIIIRLDIQKKEMDRIDTSFWCELTNSSKILFTGPTTATDSPWGNSRTSALCLMQSLVGSFSFFKSHNFLSPKSHILDPFNTIVHMYGYSGGFMWKNRIWNWEGICEQGWNVVCGSEFLFVIKSQIQVGDLSDFPRIEHKFEFNKPPLPKFIK